jgi:hypothetical protein
VINTLGSVKLDSLIDVYGYDDREMPGQSFDLTDM